MLHDKVNRIRNGVPIVILRSVLIFLQGVVQKYPCVFTVNIEIKKLKYLGNFTNLDMPYLMKKYIILHTHCFNLSMPLAFVIVLLYMISRFDRTFKLPWGCTVVSSNKAELLQNSLWNISYFLSYSFIFILQWRVNERVRTPSEQYGICELYKWVLSLSGDHVILS